MKFPELYRRQISSFPKSLPGESGLFYIPYKGGVDSFVFTVIASNELGWDHVSVSIQGRERCPKWEEMCFIKSLFWDDTETVVQYHPPKSEYVNNHAYCLHLWKKGGYEYPLPPSIMVGFKS